MYDNEFKTLEKGADLGNFNKLRAAQFLLATRGTLR